MAKTLISLGANLGNPRQVILQAGQMIANRFGEANVVFSRLYRTPAIGGPLGQDDFYNAVATIESNKTAFEVWRNLDAIEQSLGRQRRHRWEARYIDLDVLLHNGERHWTPTFKVPHPRMNTRTFVLEPACEIAATWIEPVTGQSIQNLNQSILPLRTNENNEFETVHFVVLSEDIERTHRIAEALIAGSNRSTMEQSNATAEISSDASNRLIVHLNHHRRITLQPIAPLVRPNSKSQVDDLRRHLNQQIVESQTAHPMHLLVFAGTSPDSSTIHWEDYCRNWAELLGLIASHEWTSNTTVFRSLPKYILTADDPKWAAHELLAAMTAMTCPIQPCGEFFDD